MSFNIYLGVGCASFAILCVLLVRALAQANTACRDVARALIEVAQDGGGVPERFTPKNPSSIKPKELVSLARDALDVIKAR